LQILGFSIQVGLHAVLMGCHAETHIDEARELVRVDSKQGCHPHDSNAISSLAVDQFTDVRFCLQERLAWLLNGAQGTGSE
jgi:hypothetical protein